MIKYVCMFSEFFYFAIFSEFLRMLIIDRSRNRIRRWDLNYYCHDVINKWKLKLQQIVNSQMLVWLQPERLRPTCLCHRDETQPPSAAWWSPVQTYTCVSNRQTPKHTLADTRRQTTCWRKVGHWGSLEKITQIMEFPFYSLVWNQQTYIFGFTRLIFGRVRRNPSAADIETLSVGQCQDAMCSQE